MDLLSVVALREALPAHDLPAGAKGTVVELLDADNVLVEFAGEDGVARCIAPVAVARLELQAGEFTPDAHRESAHQAKKFMLCVSREGLGEFSTDDLTLGRLYEVLSPPDSQGFVRVVDDSGDAYLYPESLFAALGT